MERGFYNEDYDFEELIRQKSDQLKMYPSDKVWKGIHGNLHSTRRWYWLSLVLFLGGISYYAVDQLISSPKKMAQSAPQSADDKQVAKAAPAIVVPFSPVVPRTSANRGPLPSDEPNNDELLTSETPAGPASTPLLQPAEQAAQAVVIPIDIQTSTKNTEQITEEASHLATSELTADPFTAMISDAAQAVLDEPVKDEAEIEDEAALNDRQKINWLQENAVYELTRPKTKRLSWQVSMSPTMNYRKLVGNDNVSLASDVKNVPIALNIQGNIDNLVNHKPALGFEVGSVFLYQLNKNLTFKTGVQFNYSRYNIQAYKSASTETATISLSNFYGSEALTSFTRLRNFGGSSFTNLKNEFYQFSTPIGLEYVVLGQRRLQLAVAGTIQPTYMLNRNNYMITTDYKNYTREPSLVRRWNANTSVEAFLSYKAPSGLKFQLGPQFRYQLLSTYVDKYPVKEFLMEYGLKLAVSRSIR